MELNQTSYFKSGERVVAMYPFNKIDPCVRNIWPRRGDVLTIKRTNCQASADDAGPFIGLQFSDKSLGYEYGTNNEVALCEELFAHVESVQWAEDVMEVLLILWGSR